jgi:tetratricopeptide (TPR) repeat protein
LTWPSIFAVLLLLAQAHGQAATVREQMDRVHALIIAGKTTDGLQKLREMLDSHPGDPEAEFEAGAVLEELAGATFKRMEQLAPESAETHELLGKYYEAQGKLPEALAQYRIALQKKSQAPGLHFLMGNVLWKQRDFDAALPELQAELRINSDHAMANHRIGNIYMLRDETARAIPYLEKAVRGEPSFVEGRRDLGKAYRLAGKLTDALRQLTFVAERSPDDESVHAQLAAVYRALGNNEKALAELKLQRELLRRRSEAARSK